MKRQPRRSAGISGATAAVPAAALAVGTLGVFAAVRDFQFISYDDGVYVTVNPVVLRGLTAAGARWAATSFGQVITTAPTWSQVERVVWAEIHRLLGAARWQLQFTAHNRTELRQGPKNFAIGLSTNEGVRFQGFHGHVLIVLDEAPGVQPDIWEAIEGIRAGGDVRVLAIGNPTAAAGPFYDAFSHDRMNWWTRSISAFDTPNLIGHSLEDVLAMDADTLDVAPRRYLVTRRWVREKHAEWGPQHPMWQARVLGDFPTPRRRCLAVLGGF